MIFLPTGANFLALFSVVLLQGRFEEGSNELMLTEVNINIMLILENLLYIFRCYSTVGSSNFPLNILSLKFPNCFDCSSIVHELLHALGFFHEQQRMVRGWKVTLFEVFPDPTMQQYLSYPILFQTWHEFSFKLNLYIAWPSNRESLSSYMLFALHR